MTPAIIFSNNEPKNEWKMKGEKNWALHMNVLSKITIIRILYEEAKGHSGQGLRSEAT